MFLAFDNSQIHAHFYFLPFDKKGESRFQLRYMTEYRFEYEERNCSASSINPAYIICLLSAFSFFVKTGGSRFQLRYMTE